MKEKRKRQAGKGGLRGDWRGKRWEGRKREVEECVEEEEEKKGKNQVEEIDEQKNERRKIIK